MELNAGFLENHPISHFGDQSWPPRSCDLIIRCLLMGYLKSKMVYVSKPTTAHALKEEITHNFNEIL